MTNYDCHKSRMSGEQDLKTKFDPPRDHIFIERTTERIMSEAKWTNIFDTIDEDGAGSIPVSKFGLAVRAAGAYPTEEEVKMMIGKVGGSGSVSKGDFLKQMKWIEKVNPLNVGEVEESFKIFDKDENGTISRAELIHILTSMGEKLPLEEAEDFVKEAETDKNGFIDYKRFLEQCTSA